MLCGMWKNIDVKKIFFHDWWQWWCCCCVMPCYPYVGTGTILWREAQKENLHPNLELPLPVPGRNASSATMTMTIISCRDHYWTKSHDHIKNHSIFSLPAPSAVLIKCRVSRQCSILSILGQNSTTRIAVVEKAELALAAIITGTGTAPALSCDSSNNEWQPRWFMQKSHGSARGGLCRRMPWLHAK